ncbi:MAG: FkbM family methyltransferase, partial [Promethearchaeota archaeon]
LKNGIQYKTRAKTHDKIIINEIWVQKQYNPPGFEINKSDTVIDIGSHIGIFSIFASKYARNGKVYTYEPISENFQLLKENIALNNIKNIIPFNKAVAGEKGTKDIRIFEDNTGGHSLLLKHKNQSKYRSKILTIETISLKDIIEENNISEIDFLKMDCEGAEYEIFLNCPDYIFKRINKLSMEYHNIDKNHNVLLLKKLLESKGFTIKIKWGGRLPYSTLHAKR